MGKKKYNKLGFGMDGDVPAFRDVPRPLLWGCGCCLIVVALVVGTVALFCVFPLLWTQDGKQGTILSAEGNVEIREGYNLTVHDSILHCGTDVMVHKTNFTPILPFGPDGSNFIFGDQGIPYSRIQAGFAVGIRLGTDSGLSPDPGLFLEDGLKFLVSPLGVHVNSVFVPVFGIFIPSDERIKTNITHMNSTQALQNVLSLQPRTYRYTEEWYESLGENTEEERGEDRRGFIAQEVEDILPHSVRRTTMALEGELVDDFRDLRKEDIVTEVVGAIQEIHYGRIIETAYNELRFADLQAQIDQTKDSPPSWIPEFQVCLGEASPGDQARCICIMIEGLLCNNQGDVGLCDPTHPLVFQCAIT